MPLPMGLAAAGIGALQNPAIQSGLWNAGSSVLGGMGRGANYMAQGAGNLGQQGATGIADILGGLGQQYLPQSVNNAGGYARQGLGYLSGGAGGLYNAVMGNNQPQQGMQQGGMNQMGRMQGGGMGGMSPQNIMQQNYQQQIQQPYQFDYANQRQQLTDQYNQQLIPQLARQFGGADAMRSSAFRNAGLQAAGNLQTNLGALQEQGRFNEANLNQNRLGQISNYLGGQQQLGLGARQLGQQGTIAQRQASLSGMGMMGGFGQQQQQNYMDRLTQALNAQGNLANLGMNQPYQTVQNQGGQAGIWQLLPYLLQGGMQAGKMAMGGS